MKSLENIAAVKKDLEVLIGRENVSTNFYTVSEYCMNHVAKNIFAMSKHKPFIVARPISMAQLIAVVKYANQEEIPIFLRGGGTGYSGGEVPTSSGIVIELTGLNKVKSVDSRSRHVVCEAGITVKDLNTFLMDNYNLWWPHDPGSRDWATVGGSIATLGCGAYTTKYGYAPASVTYMKIVTPEGEIIELGSKIRNDMTCYNMIDLFASSEGTLGIILEASLKVFPIPKHRDLVIGVFETFKEAVDTCFSIADSGLYPESLMMEDSLRFVLEGLAPHIDIDDPSVKRLQLDRREAVVIVSYGGLESFVKACRSETAQIMLSKGGIIVDDKRIVDAYWKSKTELPSWSKEMQGVRVHSFVPAIPLNVATDFNAKYNQLIGELGLNKGGARYYVVLPWMECTVSPTAIFDDNDPNSVAAYEEFTRRFSEYVRGIDGAPASTTGVGMRLLDIVEKLTARSQLTIARKIKSCIDPKNILCPDKKFRSG
ncbi:MAG: FAD-binding oxidoreductase [Candidatus Caldarchaeales archaeon]|nr:FAD-binding oxidoreductase [Candidatus Caldarchaeales archaeon]